MKKCLAFFLFLFSLSLNIQADFKISELKWVKNVGARQTPHGRKIFNVSSFGALSDGVSLNTKAIQAAIDSCSFLGGGIVTFSPGSYLTGSIYLKEGVHLLIPKGVIILGSTDIRDYPEIPTRVAGIEMNWPSALINVLKQKNVLISGEGIIYAQGKTFWNKYWDMRKDYEAKGLRWIVDYDCKRPRTVLVSESEDVTIRNLTFRQSGFWTIQLLYSSYCTVDGATIQNNIDGHGPSTDGVDIDSSSYILVENCDIDCNDDNFCLKSGRDADGLRVNRPTEYVVIRNCLSRAGGGLLTCGSETSGGIRYILAYKLKARGTTVGIRLKSAMNRGGSTDHIYFKDIEMEKVKLAFEATMNWNPAYSYSKLPEEYKGKKIPEHWTKMLQVVEPPELAIPYFRQVYLSDFRVKEADRAIDVEGSNVSWMDHFDFNNIYIEANKAGSVSYARNWTIKDVIIKSKDNLPIQIANCEKVLFPLDKDEKKIFTHVLKLDNKSNSLIVAGKDPEFAFYLPEMAGNLTFGISRGIQSKWLRNASIIRDDIKKGTLIYHVSDPLLGNGSLSFKVIALSQTDGILIEAIGHNLPEGVKLFWSFGGAYGKIIAPNETGILKPVYCKDNVFSVEHNAFTLYYGESMKLKVLQGVMPVNSDIRLSDANNQEKPIDFYNSGKKTIAPALTAILPLQNEKKEYFCIFKHNSIADYNYFMLPNLFENEIKLIKSK